MNAIKIDGLPQNSDFAKIITASMHKTTRGRTSSICSMKRRTKRKISKKGHVLCKKLFLGTIMCPSWLRMLFTKLLFLSNMSTQYF